MISIEKPKQCPFCKHCEMQQSEDVFDTWFSSALWPFAGLSPSDIKRFYPSNVLVTAREIINLWVARMIFSGLEFQNKEPFPEVFIHATVLTKDGKRMSKSLGTGIDPLSLIERYGADATRFGLIWQLMGQQDMRWDETAIVAGQKFANKLWNAGRFILLKIAKLQFPQRTDEEILQMNGSDLAPVDIAKISPKTPADRLILKQFKSMQKKFEKYVSTYQLGHALKEAYDFFWHSFADVYIEKSKTQDVAKTIPILLSVFLESIKLIHCTMPFVTEALYAQLSLKQKVDFLMVERIGKV